MAAPGLLTAAMPNPAIKIGVVDQSSTAWAAGGTYTRMTVESLVAAGCGGACELYFFSHPENGWNLPVQSVKRVELTTVDYLPAERSVRKWFRLAEKSSSFRGESYLRGVLRIADNSSVFSAAQELGIDVLLPLLDVPRWDIKPKTLGWIPDFQHVHLPNFFSRAEVQSRNNGMRRLAEKATLVLLSSQAARADFIDFAPAHAHKARVVSFPSLLASAPLSASPESTLAKFKLPAKFALVANQFWAHKNHAAVITALKRLREKDMKIPVVMTGLPSDQRDPSNTNFSSLLQAIASADLHQQIAILGHVPYSDLINLMRTAAVVIQPSRFEGWSTVVEDAKALGRPLICSDIPVHREQAPDSLGFFPCDDREVLADILGSYWQSLEPGPVNDREAEALARERDFARRHGELLLAVCKEAMKISE